MYRHTFLSSTSAHVELYVLVATLASKQMQRREGAGVRLLQLPHSVKPLLWRKFWAGSNLGATSILPIKVVRIKRDRRRMQRASFYEADVRLLEHLHLGRDDLLFRGLLVGVSRGGVHQQAAGIEGSSNASHVDIHDDAHRVCQAHGESLVPRKDPRATGTFSTNRRRESIPDRSCADGRRAMVAPKRTWSQDRCKRIRLIKHASVQAARGHVNVRQCRATMKTQLRSLSHILH